MSANREEILENFMIVTRIKNVEEAIIWLECCNWDLTSAIKNSSPEEVKLQNDAYLKKNGTSPDPQSLEQNDGFETSADETPDLRVIQVYVVHGSSIHMVRAPDRITVHCFKRLISFATNVPPCQQLITGWNQEPSSDTEVLSFMPNLSFIVLKDSSFIEEVESTAMEVDEETLDIYNLKIIDALGDRLYNLKVPGSHTIGQVKLDTYLLTNIPLASQLWIGWPEDATDNTEISCLLLNKPVHTLEIRQSKPISSVSSMNSPSHIENSENVIDVDESTDAFGGDDEDFGKESFANNGQSCLIPSTIEDEMAGSLHFIDGYMVRYGEATPCFFTGTLEGALKEAYQRPVRERRMVAMYIHHDESVLSNVFCTELLGSEATHQILSNNFVVWGWDITNDTGRRILMSSVTRTLGNALARTLSNIATESFPALFIIAPTRGQYELLDVIYGNNGISELLSMLVNAVEIFSKNMEVEIKEEDERAERQKIKHDQDTAFEQSLEMDRAKEEAKRQKLLKKSQEEERVRKQMEVEDERRRAEVAMVEAQLPSEPTELECKAAPCFSFKFRAPTGETFARRFLATDTLVVLFNFLFVKGYEVEHYKYITGWPRKDLTLMDSGTVLGELGIFSQETIILESR